ncbi:hypothetical protein SH661x_004155 [Planctomicrobium sp. SH661]|uniref:hypothetical protein n=1 Tax=Planctomicrobium sp. SH661 TaxID=3448124 RepID=UPI003F5B9459
MRLAAMPANFQFRPDRRSGPLLASTLVLFLGAIGAAVVVTASGTNPYVGLAIFAGFAAIVPVFVFLLRVSPQRTLTSLYSWIKSREFRETEEYKPKAVRSVRDYGTNRPPSVADLKELKNGTNNWVPSNVPPPSRKPKKQG